MAQGVTGTETAADLGALPFGTYCTEPGCLHRGLTKPDTLAKYRGKPLRLLPFRCARCGARGSQSLLVFDDRSEVESSCTPL